MQRRLLLMPTGAELGQKRPGVMGLAGLKHTRVLGRSAAASAGSSGMGTRQDQQAHTRQLLIHFEAYCHCVALLMLLN